MSAERKYDMVIAVDHRKKRLLFSHRGLLDKASVIQAYHTIHNVEGFSPDYDTRVDYRDITEIALGFSDFKDILEESKDIERRTGRVALVIGPDRSRYALAKLFCIVSSTLANSSIRYRAFQSLDEADSWLDTTEDQ